MATPQPQTAIIPANSPDDVLSIYIRRPEITEKFALVMKDEQARRFVQNVVILVETAEPGDWSLQNCSPRSIVRAALRAATQRVSVDPAEREAYLVPRMVKRKIGGVEKKVLEACFSFHYQEIENRAWRTGLYTHINVSPIYTGTEILIDLFTGLHAIKLENGLEVNRQSANVLASWGKSDGLKRIGWLGYYRTRHGREKTIYMTVEEIEAQVSSGNPNWKSSFMWTKHRETGERKTVLLALLRLADLKAPEMVAVREALETIDNAESLDGDGYSENEKTTDEKAIDGEIKAEANQPRTEAQNMADLYGESSTEKVNMQNKSEKSKTDPRQWNESQLAFVVNSGYAATGWGAKGMLGLSCLPADATEAEIDRWCVIYREIRPLVATNESPSSADAAEQANAKHNAGPVTIEDMPA